MRTPGYSTRSANYVGCRVWRQLDGFLLWGSSRLLGQSLPWQRRSFLFLHARSPPTDEKNPPMAYPQMAATESVGILSCQNPGHRGESRVMQSRCLGHQIFHSSLQVIRLVEEPVAPQSAPYLMKAHISQGWGLASSLFGSEASLGGLVVDCAPDGAEGPSWEFRSPYLTSSFVLTSVTQRPLERGPALQDTIVFHRNWLLFNNPPSAM